MQLPTRINSYLTGANFPHKDSRQGKYILRPVHSMTSAEPNVPDWNQSVPSVAPPGSVPGWSPLPYLPQEDPNRVPFSQVFYSPPHRSSQQPSQVRSFPKQEGIQPKQSKLNANAPEFVLSSGKTSNKQQMTVPPNLLINTRRGWRSPMNEVSSQFHNPMKVHHFISNNHPYDSISRANVFNTHIADIPANFLSVGGICSTYLPKNYNLVPPGDTAVGSVIPTGRTIHKSSFRCRTCHIADKSSARTTSVEGFSRGENTNPNSNSRFDVPNKSRDFRSKEGHFEEKHNQPSNKKQARDMNRSREGGPHSSTKIKATGQQPSRGGGQKKLPGNRKTFRPKPRVLKRRSRDRFITTHHGATIILQYSGKLSNLALHNQMQIVVLQKCAATIGLLPSSVHTMVLQECNVDIKKMKSNILTLIVEDCSPRLDYLPNSLLNLVLLRSSSSLDFLPQSIKNLIVCDSTVDLDRLPDSLREIALRNIFADHKLLPSRAVILKLWGKGTQKLSDQALVGIMASIVTWVPSELLLVVADYAAEKVGYLHNIAVLSRGEWKKAFAEYQLLERQVLDARRM